MAYQFKKKQVFSAIESDKASMSDVHNSEKIKKANAVFGGAVDITTLLPNEIIQKNIEAHNITKVKIDLIKPRNINDFENISNETLKVSIQSIGLLNPILVRTSDNGKYIIISGHRRFSAIKEIVADLKIKKAELEKAGKITQEIDKKIASLEEVPTIVFTVVEDNSELLGSDPKYITKQMEEEMYKAANLEARQISKNAIVKNIEYFYNLIQNNPDYKEHLLNQRNENAKRKATKLNMSDELAKLITKDLKFPIAPAYVWRVVNILESEEKYPKYQKIALERLYNGDSVRGVFDDFTMAIKIHESQFEDNEIRQEYHTRMEKGNEPLINIYNEYFNIKETNKQKDKKISKAKVEAILVDLKNNKIDISKALELIKKL